MGLAGYQGVAGGSDQVDPALSRPYQMSWVLHYLLVAPAHTQQTNNDACNSACRGVRSRGYTSSIRSKLGMVLCGYRQ